MKTPHPMRTLKAESGMTLIEVVLAGGVLSVALIGLMGVLSTSLATTAANRESALANEAARQMIERLQGTPFTEIFATYNLNIADDPAGLGTSPGKNFAVPGLLIQAGDPDTTPGEIIFPTDELEGLREDVVDTAWGMPRDLTGDGAIDALDHSSNYILLPVRIRIQWNGIRGDRSLEVSTILTNR